MTLPTDTLRTRPDGSIDTAFYERRGRRLRSEQAHALFRGGPASLRKRRGFARLFGGSPL